MRFEAADEAADERLRVVDLHRERVVLRRSVRGMRMALNMPVAAYRGVAIRLLAISEAKPADRSLSCSNTPIPALSLPLFSFAEADDIVAEWQSWGRVLGLPLLVAEGDGTLREPFARHRRAARRGAGLAPPPPQRPLRAGGLRGCAPPSG